MTIKKLKAAIKDLPDNMDVMLEVSETEFNLSLLENAKVRTCTFSDGPKIVGKDKCLVLTDEV